jgi:deazaflavin-dependent oxidoreductase (nitroreductase family)
MHNEVDLSTLLSMLAKEQYCYVTTRGRKTGNPHEIEIWFGIHSDCLYLLSGAKDKSDWVRNLLRDPHVMVQIGEHTFTGLARLIADAEEDWTARHLLATKYQGWHVGRALSEWGRTALVVGIDLEPASA